jgi:soluble cytochrome b562
MMGLGWDLNKIVDQMSIAIDMFPDRAEPLYHLGRYCNGIREFDLGYKYLSEAIKKSLEEVQKKYILFVNSYTYGDFVKDELSVSCYWTGRYQEGYKYLIDIIDKEEFIEDKGRLEENKRHFQNMMSQKI